MNLIAYLTECTYSSCTKFYDEQIKCLLLLLIQIADFGVSDMYEGDDDLLNKYVGSPAFQAPEVFNHGRL